LTRLSRAAPGVCIIISMAGWGSWRRRQLIVPGFQGRFIATQLAWWTVCLLLFAAVLFIPATLELRSAGDPQRLLQAADTFLLLHRYLWPALLVLFSTAAIVTIHTSHRVAGPLYRLRMVCERVTAGDLAVSARVREGDFLVQESAVFEAMLASLRERISAAQSSLAAAVDRHRDQHSEPDSSQTASASADQQAWAHIAQARDTLSAFRVVADAARQSAPDAAPTAAPVVERQQPSRDERAGFTVVEILVVAAIIGVLAAIAAPRYQAALDAARIARAIGDIKAIDKEVQVNFILNGCYPGSLKDLGRDTLRDPWGNPYDYNVLTPKHGQCTACSGSCIQTGKARKDRKLVPINSDFDLYSMGKDGKTTAPLTAAASRDDIVRGSDGGFVGLAANY
jgi:general secretion pathway protein G